MRLLLVFMLIFALPVEGQTKRARPTTPAQPTATPTVPVTLLLKDGQRLKGLFISANARTVTFLFANARQELNTSDIASLVFAESNDAPPGADSGVASEAIKELQKLASTVSVGATIGEYGRRLIDARVALDQLMPKIKDDSLKTEIALAIGEYELAAEYWQLINRMARDDRYNTGWVDTSTEWGASLVKRYSLKPEVLPSGRSIVLREEVLSAAWRAAKEHLDKALKLASK